MKRQCPPKTHITQEYNTVVMPSTMNTFKKHDKYEEINTALYCIVVKNINLPLMGVSSLLIIM
jgi:hypothetical protein